MLDLVARIKNGETDGSAPSSSHDVSEAEANFVRAAIVRPPSRQPTRLYPSSSASLSRHRAPSSLYRRFRVRPPLVLGSKWSVEGLWAPSARRARREHTGVPNHRHPRRGNERRRPRHELERRHHPVSAPAFVPLTDPVVGLGRARKVSRRGRGSLGRGAWSQPFPDPPLFGEQQILPTSLPPDEVERTLVRRRRGFLIR